MQENDMSTNARIQNLPFGPILRHSMMAQTDFGWCFPEYANYHTRSKK